MRRTIPRGTLCQHLTLGLYHRPKGPVPAIKPITAITGLPQWVTLGTDLDHNSGAFWRPAAGTSPGYIPNVANTSEIDPDRRHRHPHLARLQRCFCLGPGPDHEILHRSTTADRQLPRRLLHRQREQRRGLG